MCEGWQGLAGTLTSLATTQRDSYETIMYAHRISLYTHYCSIYIYLYVYDCGVQHCYLGLVFGSRSGRSSGKRRSSLCARPWRSSDDRLRTLAKIGRVGRTSWAQAVGDRPSSARHAGHLLKEAARKGLGSGMAPLRWPWLGSWLGPGPCHLAPDGPAERVFGVGFGGASQVGMCQRQPLGEAKPWSHTHTHARGWQTSARFTYIL